MKRPRLLCKLVLTTGLTMISTTLTAGVVERYSYEPDKIYSVKTGLGITTQIELSSSEKILDYSTGFSSGWDLTRREHVFYIRPKDVDVDTNMVIRTQSRSYIFELKVVATDWKALDHARKSGVQYKIQFAYPEDTRVETAPSQINPVSEAKPPEAHPALHRSRSYHFGYDYAMRGKTAGWLLPVNVYDDGSFTYIRMSNMKQFPTGNYPAIFMRETKRGEESVVNSSVEGDTIVVHGTYPYLVIRQDKNVIGIRRNATK